MFKNLLGKIFSTANDRMIKSLRKEIEKINAFEPELQKLTDEQLRGKTEEFKNRLSKGETIEDICYEAFAVGREASQRVLGMRHFDVQLIGALILHRGKVSEMKTGEGKTLVAVLPAYLNALTGYGVHIVTVNDYLASRDSEWMGKVYEFLGLSTGCITAGMSDDYRKAAYNSDVIYVTNNELGFDYLRDNMKFRPEDEVLREFNFAIIDEVDSILIDEARTPLIISGPVNEDTSLYHYVNNIVKQIDAKCYETDEKIKSVNLTEEGINKLEAELQKKELINPGSSIYDVENLSVMHHVNQALKAIVMFQKDVDYIVKDDKVMLIDEFTGRVMEGRRFSEGLHQAIEAKEGVEIQNENQTLASITFQNYFRMYPKLAGMTGSAMTEAAELKDIYDLEVLEVPTNKPVNRYDHDDQIYSTQKDKNAAIVEHVKNSHAKGQPILIGTVSIEKSEEISDLLTKESLPHNVLNAKHHQKEAEIIAQAGRYGAITVATNMAGRGTDIMLGGNPEMLMNKQLQHNKSSDKQKLYEQVKKQVEEEKQKVIEAGGLLVLGTERHESRRIDNQLRGRSGRQGDPGETIFYLSLEDDLMRIFASEKISGLLRNLGLKGGEAIHHPMVTKALERAQRKVEARNYDIRKNLLKFDDVMNDQRKIIFEQRKKIISSEDVEDIFTEMLPQAIDDICGNFIDEGSYRDEWDLDGLIHEFNRVFGLELSSSLIKDKELDVSGIKAELQRQAENLFESKEKNYGKEVLKQAKKHVLVVTLDNLWKEHLHQLDHLRQGISLRAYGQKDPLNEYKREAFKLFEAMLDQLRQSFIERVANLYIDPESLKSTQEKLRASNRNLQESREDPAFKKYNDGIEVEANVTPVKKRVKPGERDPEDPSTWGRVARNEYCPCNSGKKYKHCHGAV
jgi:preprotein translocase subunit SecA